MISNIKSKIVASLKSKKMNVFFLFLLFSFIILIFSKLSKDYTKTLAFRINKVNVPEDHVILNDSLALSLTLKTHGFRWLKYSFNTPKIDIDFSKDVIKRNKTYIWNQSKSYLSNTQFDKKVELLSMSPDTLYFKYDANMVKNVPIKLNSNIKFSTGYNAFEDLELQPDSVVVIGPHILVSKINSLETDELVLQEVRKDIDEKINIKLPENNTDLKFSTKSTRVKVNVEKFTEGTLKVPVEVKNVPKNINLKYFPKEVSVAYYVSLNNFKEVKSSDFKIVCDYKNVKGSQMFLVPELVAFPETVKSAKISHQQIEFIITK